MDILTDLLGFATGITGFDFTKILTITSIFSLIFYILLVIALYKIFEKANEAGWKALIPIYNYVVLFKIVGLSPWYLLLYLLVFIPNIIVYLIFAMCWIVLKIVFSIDMSHSFGRHLGTTLGIFFIPSIFYLILRYGSAVYEGPYGEKN